MACRVSASGGQTKRPGPRVGAGTLLVVRPLLFPDHRAGESPVPERPRLEVLSARDHTPAGTGAEEVTATKSRTESKGHGHTT